MGKLISKLQSINSPSDLKKLPLDELPALCQELRHFILEQVSINPGHLGSSLGVIELTVALHYVFESPEDAIIWDVGHQAYAHKILTGRRDKFHTNRRKGGLCGFPKINESEHDAFGVGHASTSLSASLGIAIANAHSGKQDQHCVAIIGDGAMTGGLAFEGLNNMSGRLENLLIILNDNNMSINSNVGGVSQYLTRFYLSSPYNRMKRDVWNLLGKKKKNSLLKQFFSQALSSFKSFFLKDSSFFEALGIRYFGPIDGHDVIKLVHTLQRLKRLNGHKLLHAHTLKGKGYSPAEKDALTWHSPGQFDVETGERNSQKKGGVIQENTMLYQDVFGKYLQQMGRKYSDIITITPAMINGSSLQFFKEEFPERLHDVGIAEGHAVTFAGGIATQGMVPFCVIYSSFLQRGFDQIIHDVALQKLPVRFFIDRAGLVGEDGPTHHGVFDLAYLNIIPNMTLAAPMDEEELCRMMETAYAYSQGPIAVRYPRGKGVGKTMPQHAEPLPIGQGEWLRQGKEICLLSIGHVGNTALRAIEKAQTEGINVAHANMRFLKPIDTHLLNEATTQYPKIITVEDGTIVGGLGSVVADFIISQRKSNRLVKLGVPDQFVEHGKIPELHQECGYDEEGILHAIRSIAN